MVKITNPLTTKLSMTEKIRQTVSNLVFMLASKQGTYLIQQYSFDKIKQLLLRCLDSYEFDFKNQNSIRRDWSDSPFAIGKRCRDD